MLTFRSARRRAGAAARQSRGSAAPGPGSGPVFAGRRPGGTFGDWKPGGAAYDIGGGRTGSTFSGDGIGGGMAWDAWGNKLTAEKRGRIAAGLEGAAGMAIDEGIMAGSGVSKVGGSGQQHQSGEWAQRMGNSGALQKAQDRLKRDRERVQEQSEAGVVDWTRNAPSKVQDASRFSHRYLKNKRSSTINGLRYYITVAIVYGGVAAIGYVICVCCGGFFVSGQGSHSGGNMTPEHKERVAARIRDRGSSLEKRLKDDQEVSWWNLPGRVFAYVGTYWIGHGVDYRSTDRIHGCNGTVFNVVFEWIAQKFNIMESEFGQYWFASLTRTYYPKRKHSTSGEPRCETGSTESPEPQSGGPVPPMERFSPSPIQQAGAAGAPAAAV